MKTTCEELSDKIVDYVDGELPAEEAQIVARHLSECPRCRQIANDLQRSLGLATVIWQGNLVEATAVRSMGVPPMNSTAVPAVSPAGIPSVNSEPALSLPKGQALPMADPDSHGRDAHVTPFQTEPKPALREPTLRKMIMRNSYVKLALAAVIIVAVVLGVTEFLGPGSKSGVAWAQVLEKAERAPTVVFDATEEYSYPQGRKVVLRIKTCRSTEYGDKSEVYEEGKLLSIHYWLPRQKVAYVIRPDRKQYARTDMSEGEAAWGSQDDPRSWLKKILSGKYTKLGRTTINGRAAEGVECKLGETAGQDIIMRLWVDVQTTLPVRIEHEELHMLEGQMRPLKSVMENLEWDAQLDEGLFEPNIPADYTPRPREEL
jgi:anti-sigma factor RsiW